MTIADMGGTSIANDTREAASALRWWLQAGVDTAIQESPRNWLAPEPAAALPEAAVPADQLELPGTLGDFRSWLSTNPAAPLASSNGRTVLPLGGEEAEVMLLCDPPGRDEIADGRPVGGDSAELLTRMLQAIGMADQAYLANLSCFAAPGARLTREQLDACADAARHHIKLARPRRLLLLGEGPSQALLGKPMSQARGHVHKIESVPTIATFHPRQLLKRPSDKALAWKDLLLLIEDRST